MIRRLVIWGGIALASVFLLASAVLYFLYPKEVLIQRFIPVAEAQMGRPIKLADAGISFWPPFGMYIEGLIVANEPPAIAAHLLQVDYARGQLSLGALLRGKVVLTSVECRGVRASWEVFDDGSSNIADLTNAEGNLTPVWIEHLELTDAAFVFRDARDQRSILLSEMDVEITSDAGESTGQINLTLGHFTFTQDTNHTEISDPLSVVLQGSYNAGSDRLNLDRVAGSLLQMPFDGSVSIESLFSEPLVIAEFETGPVEVSDLQTRWASALSDSVRLWLEAYEVFGGLRGHATYRGAATSWPLDELKGELIWVAGSVHWNNHELLQVASMTIPMDFAGYHVSVVDAELLGGPLKLAMVGNWPDESRIEVTVSGEADLARAGEAMQTPGLGGRLDYQATIRGRHDRPEAWDVRMRLEPRGARFAQPDMAELGAGSGRLTYDGKRATLSNLELVAGSSRVIVDAEAVDLPWSGFFDEKRDSVYRADVSLRGTHLDLDQFASWPAAEAAHDEAVPESVPLPLSAARLQVRMDFDTLIAGGTRMHDVSGQVSTKASSLNIDTLRGRVFDGRAGLKGEIDFQDPEMPGYDLTMRLDSIKLEPFWNRFGALGQHLKGRGSIDAALQANGVPQAKVLDSLTVTGTTALFDASVVGLQTARKIVSLLGINASDSIPLQSRWNVFHLDDGRVRLDDFRFNATNAAWVLSGTIGLDGSMDYRLSATLSRTLSDQFTLPRALAERMPIQWTESANPVSLLKNESGEAELFIRVSGTYLSPAVSFDWERQRMRMKDRFDAKVKERAKDEIKGQVKKGLKDLFNPQKP